MTSNSRVSKPQAKPGDKVTFLHPKRTNPQKCTLGKHASDDPSIPCISCNTPIGKALIGKRPGEKVKIQLPCGEWVTLQVIEVVPAAAAKAA